MSDARATTIHSIIHRATAGTTVWHNGVAMARLLTGNLSLKNVSLPY